MRKIKGFNILLDLHNCNEKKMNDILTIKEKILEFAESSGFKVVGEKYHLFKPHGFTGILLLASSHVSIHTWPELNFIAIDIYSCKGKYAAKKLSKKLIKFFEPKSFEIKEVIRFR